MALNLAFPPLLPAVRLVGATAALAFATEACAMERFGWPDLREEDKQEHAMGGFIVGSLVTVAVERTAPRSRWWEKALVGVAASAIVGLAKEGYDAHHRGHDCDPKDATATILGGAAGVLSVELIWRF